LSLVDFEEEKDRDSWGSLPPDCMDVLRLKPVEARSLFFLEAMSPID
jgi:hypothetical protein